jgi:hypothetical protein
MQIDMLKRIERGDRAARQERPTPQGRRAGPRAGAGRPGAWQNDPRIASRYMTVTRRALAVLQPFC